MQAAEYLVVVPWSSAEVEAEVHSPPQAHVRKSAPKGSETPRAASMSCVAQCSGISMKNLTDLVRCIPLSSEESPEDIFAFAPGLLFTDDLRNTHGDPGDTIIYQNTTHGELELRTADPVAEDERRLFSHYLWNAGVLMGERVCGARIAEEVETALWDVKGKTVLELGAGVGLAGIVSVLQGAERVVISDYPSPVVLKNIERNANKNLSPPLLSKATITGHQWGVFADPFSAGHAHQFDRVLAADCYWMPTQQSNLARSMLHFLSFDPQARVLAIAGFHTGRNKLAGFWDIAVEEGLEVEEIYEEDADGHRREWAKEVDGGRENVTERKRWLVIAVLRRAQGQE